MFFFKKVRGKGVGVGFSLPYRGKKKKFFLSFICKKIPQNKKKTKKKILYRDKPKPTPTPLTPYLFKEYLVKNHLKNMLV